MGHDRTGEGSGRPTKSGGILIDREEDMVMDAVTVGLHSGRIRESEGRITETPLQILASVCIDTQSKKRCSRLFQQSEELLPGIFDDVTLNEITTKLPWTALQALASVSPRWQQAIDSHQVYDARVRRCSTEPLVLLADPRAKVYGLYSMVERSSHPLPPLPFLEERFLGSAQSVSINGKMYVLGGDASLETNEARRASLQGESNGTDVFVLDLAGSMVWKRCASMLEPRASFDCVVVNGKIFVCGGRYHNKPVGGSEVYDPKTDVWSSIPPTKYMRDEHDVRLGKNAHFVYGGACYPTGNLEVTSQIEQESQIYRTLQKDWSQIERIKPYRRKSHFYKLFTAQGELYLITIRGIHVHRPGWGLWQQQHSFSFPTPTLAWYNIFYVELYQIVVENDQLLVGVRWSRNGDDDVSKLALFRTRGFGSKIIELTWEKVTSSLVAGQATCLIHL